MRKITPFELSHAILIEDDVSISLQAKYLLIRMLCVFEGQPSKDTVQQLARKIGMPRAALTKAQSELVDKGWAKYSIASNFSRKHIGISANGNFRRGFVVDSRLFEEVRARAARLRGETPVPDGRRGQMLAHLLLWRAPVAADRVPQSGVVPVLAPKLNLPKGEKLPYQARLVMGVLLCLADRHGIAWDCPMKKLAGLTGMTVAQVSYQLRTLEQKGLIRYRVPGRNGQLFFHQSPGAIVLDLGEGVVPREHNAPPAPSSMGIPEIRFQSLKTLRIPLGSTPRLFPQDRIGIDAKVFVEQVTQFYARIPANRWNENCEKALVVAIDRVTRALVNHPTVGESRYALYRVCRYATMVLQGVEPTLSPSDPLLGLIRQNLARSQREKQLGFEFSVAAGLLFLIVRQLVAEIRVAFARGGLPSAVIPGAVDSRVIGVFGDFLGVPIFPSDQG